MSRLSRAPSSRGSDNAGLAKPDGEEKIVPRFANAEDPDAEEVGDDEIFEFLEGLIEGFRAAAQAAAAESLKPKEEELAEQAKEVPKPKPEAQKTNVKDLVKRGGARGLGAWAELDALGKANQKKAERKATIIPEAEEEAADAQAFSPAQRTSGGSPALSAEQRTSGGSGGYAAQAPGSQATLAMNRPSSARQSDKSRQSKPSSGPLLGNARQSERLEEAPLQRADSPGVSSKRSQASGVAALKGAMGQMASRTQSSYVGSSSENRSQSSSGVAAIMSGPLDSVSSLMRLHALRSFFEETCGTVANAFDLMASTALRAQGGSGGSAEDRLSYLFQEDEFRNILAGMGYGVDATAAWWKGLFLNIDADRDGKISLQDMYDTMVLDLPIMDGDDTNVFFAGR